MAEKQWEPIPILPGQETLPGMQVMTQNDVIKRLGVEGWEFADVTLAIKAVCGEPFDLTAQVTGEQLEHIRHTLSAVWRAPKTGRKA